MSFADTMSRVIADSHPSRLDHLSQLLWQGHCSGALDDAQAQALAEAIHRQRGANQANAAKPLQGPPRGTLRPPEQRSPDRRQSRERRRDLSLAGALPYGLARRFTNGEIAILTIIAAEIRAHGVCSRSLGEIAARAGCCRKTAQRALAAAAREGLVTIRRRPRPGRRHLSNIVAIVSREWLSWIERGAPRDRGTKKSRHGRQIDSAFNGKPGRLHRQTTSGSDNGWSERGEDQGRLHNQK